MDECRAKRSMPTFYLGYTREYDPRTWIEDEKNLEKSGVKIFQV
jgi:hypothetical protein